MCAYLQHFVSKYHQAILYHMYLKNRINCYPDPQVLVAPVLISKITMESKLTVLTYEVAFSTKGAGKVFAHAQ